MTLISLTTASSEYSSALKRLPESTEALLIRLLSHYSPLTLVELLKHPTPESSPELNALATLAKRSALIDLLVVLKEVHFQKMTVYNRQYLALCRELDALKPAVEKDPSVFLDDLPLG